VLNNPLSYTDPSGFFFQGLFKAIGNFFGNLFKGIGNILKQALKSGILRSLLTIVGCAAVPVACPAISAVVTLATGGSLKDALMAFVMSFANMGIDMAVSSTLNGLVDAFGFAGAIAKGAVHGVIQGALSVAQGGSFIQGFAGGFAGAIGGYAAGQSGAFGAYGDGNPGMMLARALISGAAGCAGAAVTGGNCATAALSAAFASMFNGDVMSQMGDQSYKENWARLQACAACSGRANDTWSPFDFLAGPISGGLRGLMLRGCSFKGDTRVKTRRGMIAIRDLHEDEEVFARNEHTGELGWRRITSTYANTYAETVTVVIRDETTGAQQSIASNRVHPYYVFADVIDFRLVVNGYAIPGTNSTGNWIEAQHLHAGNRLLNENGTFATILSVAIAHSPLKAYNLTVDEFHTYFVTGADNDNAPAVWVHNNCASVAAANLRAIGLADVELAGASYGAGRKALESAGYVLKDVTETGRKVFVHPNGGRVTYDSGAALTSAQQNHWTIQTAAGDFLSRSGRVIYGPSPPMGGKHIPGAR
jgi:hypothetical protein